MNLCAPTRWRFLPNGANRAGEDSVADRCLLDYALEYRDATIHLAVNITATYTITYWYPHVHAAATRSRVTKAKGARANKATLAKFGVVNRNSVA